MKICMKHIVKCIVACTGALLVGVLPQLAAAQDVASHPFMNPKLPAEQRAADLVHRMTLAEKALEMQNNSAAVPRLNIPAYQWWSEALHGVINEGVTEYPEPIGLAATFGAGVTAQLGAMRVNEEIDALESMAIRPVSYLISTRLVAGMVAITPLYAIAVILSFVASRYTTVALLGQSSGLYDHYFSTFLNPMDLLWSFLQAILMALAILLIHTYFGFFASGGPSGVGIATGDAVRTSLVVVVSVTLLVSLSIYGRGGGFNLAG